jgi:sulfatase modifying factor 1
MKAIYFSVSVLLCALLFFSLKIEKDKSDLKKILTKSFVYVPSGNAIVGEDTVLVQGFYIYEKEVTNIDYKEFLADLKNEGDLEKLKIAMIDSIRWNGKNQMNEKYVQYYHTHPAYNEYPVVNISHEAAQLFCEWISKKYEIMHGRKLKFRLMEKAEYIRAARGDSQSTYSWGTHNLRNLKGQAMCNHTQLTGEHIHRDQETNAYQIKVVRMDHNIFMDVLAPSKSYWPNQFKVYNMNGNAAEMIAERGIAMGGSWKDPGYDVRVESERTYTVPSPTVGFRFVVTPVDN